MKERLFLTAVFLTACVLLTACGASSDGHARQSGSAKSVSDILKEAETETAPENAAPEEKPADEKSSSPKTVQNTPFRCDVDLTLLSSTMVYSEVYNMMSDPLPYVGKTVKMRGSFAVYEGESRNYYACLIADATACCSQGIEFVLDSSLMYPDDYPKPGETITVTGVFDVYEEDGAKYCQLLNAELLA